LPIKGGGNKYMQDEPLNKNCTKSMGVGSEGRMLEPAAR